MFINPTGSPAMATAGQGDVLSGFIAGMLAEHEYNTMAVPVAAFLHGLAGELIAQKKGVALAGAMIDAFQEVYR